MLASGGPNSPLLLGSSSSIGTHNGTSIYTPLGSGTFEGLVKNAVSYSLSGKSVVGNGGAVSVSTNIIGDLTALYVGSYYNGMLNINGFIRSISYWSERKNNAELKLISTP